MSIGTVPPQAQWKRWQPTPPVLAAWGVLSVAFLFTYWETLHSYLGVWCRTPDYQHAFFVPPFAAYLLWQRQEMVNPWPKWGSWWGIPFLLVFAFVRWLYLYLNVDRDIDSLFPFLAGWAHSRRMACPAVGLAFNCSSWLSWSRCRTPSADIGPETPTSRHAHECLRPADGRHSRHFVGRRLQRHSAHETGKPVGNRPDLQRIADDDALLRPLHWGGLRLARACWKKIVVILDAVPIAIVSNVLRIVVTGMLMEWWSKPVGMFFHDEAGWVMMIWAMLMIWGEMSLLSALLIETPTEGPLSFGGQRGARPRPGSLLGPMALGPRPEKPPESSPETPRPTLS